MTETELLNRLQVNPAMFGGKPIIAIYGSRWNSS
jgi:uncharacterized protein (DUF433 family)